MDQKTLEQKTFRLQMYREQAKQAREEIMRLQAQLQEIETVRASLASLEKEKEGAEALIPLGAGIFISGTLGNTKEALILAGAGIAVKKTSAEAAEFLGEKSAMIRKAISDIDGEIKRIGVSAQAISEELGAAQGLPE